MDKRELIFQKLMKLPDSKQGEVIDFIDSLDVDSLDIEISGENIEWSNFSLANVSKDFEDEKDLYTLEDLKIKYSG